MYPVAPSSDHPTAAALRRLPLPRPGFIETLGRLSPALFLDSAHPVSCGFFCFCVFVAVIFPGRSLSSLLPVLKSAHEPPILYDARIACMPFLFLFFPFASSVRRPLFLFRPWWMTGRVACVLRLQLRAIGYGDQVAQISVRALSWPLSLVDCVGSLP